MPPVEIDEADLQSRTAIAQFVQQAMQNPETRKLMMQVQKKLYPDSVTENDVAEAHLQPVMNEITKINERINKREEEEATAKEEGSRKALETRFLNGRSAAQQAGYTEEGLEKLEEFMTKNGILDHEIAIPAFEKDNPPPEPVNQSQSPFHAIFAPEAQADGSDLKPLWDGDENAFLRSTVNDTLGRRVL